MNDNFFKLLLNLFEHSLSQLHRDHRPSEQQLANVDETEDLFALTNQSLYVRAAHTSSTRILTYTEQMKLTKAGYQFLMKMKLWGIVTPDCFEEIMNQLDSSDSRIITLQEIKWTIRYILANNLNEKQLAFLDLVLHPAENQAALH